MQEDDGKMGHVEIRLRLGNPVDPTRKPLDQTAVVDTGPTFTTIPKSVSEELGLRKIGKRRVRTATEFDTLDQSFASVEIDGNFTVTPVLVSEKLDKILLGVITLEALALTVDPTTGRLKEAETYLLFQSTGKNEQRKPGGFCPIITLFCHPVDCSVNLRCSSRDNS